MNNPQMTQIFPGSKGYTHPREPIFIYMYIAVSEAGFELQANFYLPNVLNVSNIRLRII